MASKHLATYLNDHLAGAATGMELLGYVAAAYVDTDAGRTAAQLLTEVAEDRKVLEAIMRQLAISESTVRKTSAWLAEKAVQLKLRLDDPAGGSFRLLEAVEAISLGIEGKRLLWRALAALPNTQSRDWDTLISRAEQQRARIEEVRLAAARISFVDEFKLS